MDKDLIIVKKLLEEVLAPTPSAPYITSDEIDIIDQKIKEALAIINKLLDH